MSTFRQIADNFVVGPQLRPADMPAIQEAGFKTIICTSPDGEEPGQPTAQTIGEAAAAVGISFVSIPVVSGQAPSSDAVIEMQEALNTLPDPILCYCRSGNRAGQLWELATHG